MHKAPDTALEPTKDELLSFPRTYPFGYQFKALFLKNVSLQRRQKGTNACQIITPLAIILLTGVLHVIFTNLINNSLDGDHNYDALPVNVTANQTRWDSPTHELWVSDETGGAAGLGSLNADCSRVSGLLGDFLQVPLSEKDQALAGGAKCAPWSVSMSAEEARQAIIAEKKYRESMLMNEWYKFKGTPTHRFPLAVIKATNSTAGRIAFDLGLEEEGGAYDSYTAIMLAPIARSGLRAWLLNSFLAKTGKLVYLAPSVKEMPEKSEKLPIDFGSYIFAYLTPFALSFLVPVFVYTIVHEKQQRLREMMKMMGLKMGMYWSINFVYDCMLYFIVVIVYIAIGLAFRLRVFTQTAGHIQFFVYAGWGLSQISFAFLLSVFFNKSRNATVGSYMIVIFSILISFIWNQAAWPVDDGKQSFWLVLLYPPWAVYRSWTVIGIKCGQMLCPTSFTTELTTIVCVLWVSVPVMLILAVYLDQVLPSEWGVRRHPLFFLSSLGKLCRKKTAESKKVTVSPRDEVDETGNAQPNQAELDADVAEEMETVRSLLRNPNMGEEAPVVVNGVRKIYGSGKDKKVALSGVSLHVQKNECLGLLGPNGAGKTTLISVLTGLFPASGGNAAIAGYDVGEDMRDIHKVLGVCPQFDTLWPELTPFETMLFYARMRGIAGKNAAKAAKNILRSVGLGEAIDRQVTALSGGMRRRLSIAISLVGEPKVLFLDEPTTGLDVITRRELWDVLMRAQVGRSTVLTTHSMEEADALCQRIAIVTGGRLKAIGTNVHLKDRFGGGYSIKLSFKPENEERVDKFVESVAPGAKETDSLKGLKSFRIPAGVSVAGIFRQMVASQSDGIIINWGLAQATLEDVFLALVRGMAK
eukprot:m51a1_g5659 hypothetical protein (868) ;mRNA; f:894559-897621